MNLLQNSENKRRLDLINDMIKFINNKLPQLFKQDDQTQQNMHIVQHESKPCIVHIDRQYRDDLKADPINSRIIRKTCFMMMRDILFEMKVDNGSRDIIYMIMRIIIV